MSDAAWQRDPYQRHELRYWNGSAWTEHVSDAGVQAVDPPDPSVAAPPPPAVAPTPATSSGGWADRLKQAAQQALEGAQDLADKTKAAVAEQQARRAQAAANDPNTMWVGERKSATSGVGVGAVHYRITRDSIYVESGVVGTSSNQVPLWAVRDVDVRQSVLQQGKDIGDVVVHLGHPQFYGEPEVVLDNIEGPYQVRDLLNTLVRELRSQQTAPPAAAPPGTPVGAVPPVGAAPGAAAPPPAAGPAPAAASPPPDLADQLRKLADLRDQGVLTDEEFATQKQRLLGG